MVPRALRLFGALVCLTPGRIVYFYDTDVPSASMLYTSTNHGSWRLALRGPTWKYASSWRLGFYSDTWSKTAHSQRRASGYPRSDTRSKCVVLPSQCSTFEHAVQRLPSWFPYATLPHHEAVLCLTHGRNVYFYHLDIPPVSILYRSTHHGFWRLAVQALPMAWLPC